MLLLLFVAIVFAKCRLWDTVVENSVMVTRSKETCNDWEQFYQCQRAQYYLDKYTKYYQLNLIDVGCQKHLLCIGWFPTLSGKYYCSQFDSYRLCLSIKDKISNSFKIRCSFDHLQEIGPILFYAAEREVNNSFPPLVLPPGLTTSLGSKLNISIMLLVLSIFLFI